MRAAFLLCLAPVLSHAQITTSSGVNFGAAISAGPQGRALFVDDQGRFLVQPSDASGTQTADLECWVPGAAAKVSSLANSFAASGGFSTLFAGPGRATFVTATWAAGGTQTITFTKVGCAVSADPAGGLIYTALATPLPSTQGVLPLLSTGAVVYPTASGLYRVTLAATTPSGSLLLSMASLDLVLGNTGLFDAQGNSQAVDQHFQGLAASPDDHLWAIVERRVLQGPRYQWLIEVTPAGQATVRRGPDVGVSFEGAIVYDGLLNAMLFDARMVPVGPAQPFAALGVVPLIGRDGLSARVPPWPAFPKRAYFPAGEEWRGLLGASSGGAYVATHASAYAARPLLLDKSVADFDRDGLTRSEEDMRGTSDFVADSDGDGVNDGLEVRLYMTSPVDAGSAPPIDDAGQSLVLAESILSATWDLDAGAECVYSGGHSSGRALVVSLDPFCQDGDSKWRFVGLNGLPLSSQVAQSVVAPLLTADLGHAFSWRSGGAWTRLDLQSGAEVDPLDFGGHIVSDLFPLSKDVVLGAEGAGKLWRFGPQAPFAVIDLARACPIVGSAADLPRCAELAVPGIEGFALRGWDPIRRMALAVVTTDRGRMLFGIDETRAVHLSELLSSAEGLEPLFIAPLGTRGFAMQLGGSSVTDTFLGTVRLDDLFRPLPAWSPLENPERTAGYFRNGFSSLAHESYSREPAPASPPVCSRVAFAGGSFGCDSDSKPLRVESVKRAFSAELIPVGPAIDKGEVVFFASGLSGDSAKFRERDGSYGRFAGGPGWRLWRFTPVGATLPWLDEAEFIARLDPATRAKVALKPLGAITAMGAAADSLSICLVESGRVWDLKLDPTTRLLTLIALTESPTAVGCAWDAAGKPAILTTSPAVIHTVGRDLPVSAADFPIGLMRISGKWIVVSDRRPAVCVDDDGTVLASSIRTSAASPGFGGVVWLDEAGQGFVASTSGFCAGKAQEQLGEAKSNVWMDAYRWFTPRSVQVERGAIAMRPDGLLLLGAPSVNFGGLGFDPPIARRLLFAYFPAYVPLDVSKRMTEVDPFRAPAPRAFIAARKPLEISAMVLVPGADATTDFGHLVRREPIAPMSRDAGMGGGAGGGGGSGTTKPCGCSSVEGGLAALALQRFRRRRPSSPAAPTDQTAQE